MLMFPFIWLFDEFGGEKVWLYVHSTLLGHRRGINDFRFFDDVEEAAVVVRF